MGRFDGILLCSDYDGTLAALGGIIPTENVQAIEYFKSEGGLFTVASGRSAGFILERCSGCLPNAPVVTLNGGVITDMRGETVLRVNPLENAILEMIDEIVETAGFTGKLEAWPTDSEVISWHADMGKKPSELISLAGKPLVKIVTVHDTEESAVVMRDLCRKEFTGQFTFDRSWPEGLEILPASGGKGAGARQLKELCGDVLLVTAGDFENDAALLAAGDIGYAVENAVDAVKAAADRITVKNTEFAIARIISELEKR